MFGIITDALIILAGAILIGELFEQFRLPSVAGELLSGIIIGPTLLGAVAISSDLQAVSSIALFFIIFHIGLEMKTQMVRKHISGASLLTLSSFLVPLLLTTTAAVFLLPFDFVANVVIALAISVPSISIASVLVLRFKLIQTNTGQVILSSVTVSDVVAFIILTGLTRSLEATMMVILEVAVFVITFALVDWVLNKKSEGFQGFLKKAGKLFRREEFPFALLIIAGLLVAVIFQNIGLSYIIGAFFAGLIIHDGLIGPKAHSRITETLAHINRIFFIPLFFGIAGLEVNLWMVGASEYAVLALIITVAFAAGVYLTFYLCKRCLRRSSNLMPRQVAAILGGRGAIGIVIATVALQGNVLDETGFSLVIVATLVMSLITPFLTGDVGGIDLNGSGDKVGKSDKLNGSSLGST